MENIGRELALYRTVNNLTQADVAKALGVTQQTIANWEAGRPIRGGRALQLRQYLAGQPVPPPGPDTLPFINTPTMDPGERYEQRRAVEAEFSLALPEALRQYQDRDVTMGNVKWRPDYLSDKLCAEIKWAVSTHPPVFIERAVMNLAAIRQIRQGLDHYALIIIGGEPVKQSGYSKINASAMVLGVDIYFVPDAIAAAALIADLEYGPME